MYVNSNELICNRFVFTKCKGKNCTQLHISPRELWKILKDKNEIDFVALNKIKFIPYCKNYVSGRCKGTRCSTDSHWTTKQVIDFLIKNKIVNKHIKLN